MRTMIAVPCMDQVQTAFFRSCVGLQLDGEVQWTTCQSSLIYDARNKLADLALGGEFDRVLWLDSDMVFDPFLFRRLSEHLDQGREMITGLYFGRKAPVHPVIYKALRVEINGDGHPEAKADPFDDYERDSLFEVAGCGFGAVMMTTQLLQEVRDRFRLPFFPVAGFGEDFAFCLRVRELGHRIWCDSSIKLGHEGTTVIDEEYFEKSEEFRVQSEETEETA